LNTYGYVGGNPTNAIDPSGLCIGPLIPACPWIISGAESLFLHTARLAATAVVSPAARLASTKFGQATIASSSMAELALLSTSDTGIYGGGFVNTGKSCMVVRNELDDLLRAGMQLDKNGLTKAGRALQKHGDREGSVFPRSTGSSTVRNQQGQDILNAILSSNNRTTRSNRFNGQDIFDANTGRGVRFDAVGNMMGFLEP